MTRGAGAARLRVPVGAADHVRGPRSAPVTVVEYGDYECPHCGQAHPLVKALLERVGGYTGFVFA